MRNRQLGLFFATKDGHAMVRLYYGCFILSLLMKGKMDTTGNVMQNFLPFELSRGKREEFPFDEILLFRNFCPRDPHWSQ